MYDSSGACHTVASSRVRWRGLRARAKHQHGYDGSQDHEEQDSRVHEVVSLRGGHCSVTAPSHAAAELA